MKISTIKTSTRLIFSTLAFCAFTSHFAGAEQADKTLHVEISNVRNAKGNIGCLLFNSFDGYPEIRAKAYKETHAPIELNHASCEFKNIPQGIYAVIALHDENKNHKMDKNFMGIPQEGYAASNNEHPAFSAPKFKESSFALSNENITTIKIQMRY